MPHCVRWLTRFRESKSARTRYPSKMRVNSFINLRNSNIKMEEMSAKAFSRKVKSKADLYEALVRNGYFLPKYKSSMISEHYLVNVMDKTYWCPLAESIRVRMCPR